VLPDWSNAERICSARPPLMPAQSYDTREEWEARIDQARSRFGRG
jgi:hypothetical protein